MELEYNKVRLINILIIFLIQFELLIAEGPNLFDGRLHLDYMSNHEKGKGIFWIYGDSLSYHFYESFSKNQAEFCQNTFKMCNVSYNWIYPKTLYELVSLLFPFIKNFFF